MVVNAEHLNVRFSLPLAAVTIRTAYKLALYVTAMHAVRFTADCVYMRLCAPTPSWSGFLQSMLMSNSDVCVLLRKTCGFVNDAMALAFVGGMHALVQTVYGSTGSSSS